MKTKYYILLQFICLFPSVIYAQNKEQGIFLSAEDFLTHKVSYASPHTHIKLHEVFKKESIEVKTKDSTYTFLKKDIFGYQDHEGCEFRFFEGKIYPILNPYETILIYKVSDGVPLKGQTQSFTYHFSIDAVREIIPLTMANFENAFAHDKAYSELLEVHFNNSNDLLEYDDIHKMYKINRLLHLSKK